MPDEYDGESSSTDNLKGQYSNHFRIGYNAFEFIIDFGQLYEESKNAQFHMRVVTSPAYALELEGMLADSIREYEEKFGNISNLYDDA